MKNFSKINFNILVVAMALLLTSCSGKKKEVVYGTIKDVNNEESEAVATDNLGNEITTARRIEDKYPELEMYSEAEHYPGIYIPIIGKYFDEEKFYCISHNPEYVMICDYDDPYTTYTFGRINDINSKTIDGDQGEAYTFLSTLIPMTEFGYYDQSTISEQSLIRADIIDTNEEWIEDRQVKGYHLNAITEATTEPPYVYLACDKFDKDAIYALMTSYNVDNSGAVKSLYTLERSNGNRIYKEAKEAPKTVYKVHKSTISLAVPSYLDVEEGSNGLRVKEKEESVTPFSGSGCTVLYVSGGLNTKEQAETLMAELNSLADKKYAYDTVDVQYEENVDFLGVSDATHLSGVMRSRENGLEVRKNVCGTGEIYYDIFSLNRNGKDMLVMFYRGKEMNEEFSEFIRYNTY